MYKRFIIPALILFALVPFSGVVGSAQATAPSWDPTGAGFQGLPDNDDASARFMVLSGPANNSLVGTEGGPGETFVQLIFTPASASDPIRVAIFDANGVGSWDQRAFGILLQSAPNIRYRLYPDPTGDAHARLQDVVAANDPTAIVTTNSETDYDNDPTTDNEWVSFFDQPASAIPAAIAPNGTYRFLMRISMAPASNTFALEGPERAGHKISFNGTYILPGGTVFGFAGGAVDERTLVGTENQAIHDTRDPKTYLTAASAPPVIQNAGKPYLYNGVVDFLFRSGNACTSGITFSEADADFQTSTTVGQVKTNPLQEPALVGIPPDNVPFYLRPGDTFNFRDVSAFMIYDDIGAGPRPVRWSIYPVADITTPPDGSNTPANPTFTDTADAPSNHASVTAAKQAGVFQSTALDQNTILANSGFYRVRWESVDISNFVFMKFDVDVGTTPISPKASGRIFCDANDNGTFEEDADTTWTGGVVNLELQRIDCVSKNAIGAAIPVATDAAGLWSVSGLLEGCYTIDVTDTLSFQPSNITLPFEFELSADDCDKQIDIGYICSQSICGELFCDDNGDCVFGGSDGVLPAGASATIVATPIDPVSKLPVGTATMLVLDGTDSHEWCIDNLASGTYLITLDSDIPLVDSPCAVSSHERTLSPDTVGQLDDVIFPLTCMNEICGRVFCDDDESGDFTEEDDRALAGVRVEARPTGSPLADPVTATTELDGTYCLLVAPGTWTVTVPVPQVPALEGVNPAQGEDLTEGADTSEGSVDEIDFLFDCSSSISGKVFCEGPDEDCDGEFDDGIDEELDGIAIELLLGDTVVDEVNTDVNGDYIFTGVAPSGDATYTVRVKAGQAELAGKIGPNPTLYTDIVVPEGNELTSTITDKDFGYCRLEIEGRVYCEGGPDNDCNGRYDADDDTPLAGIAVRLLKDDVQVGAAAITDANGIYTFAVTEIADYTVEVVEGQAALEGKTGPTPLLWNAKFTEQPATTKMSIRNLDFAYCRTTTTISGKIWCERPTLRVGLCNNVYDPNVAPGEAGGDDDALLEGILVELVKDNVVVETKATVGNGRYLFEDVETDSTYTVRVKTGQAALATKVGPNVDGHLVQVPADVTGFSSDDNDFVVCQLWICPLAWCDVNSSGQRESIAAYTEPVLNLRWEIRPQGQPNGAAALSGASCDWIDSPYSAPNPAEGVDVGPGSWTLTIIAPTGDTAPTPANGVSFDFVVDENSTAPFLPHFPFDCLLTVNGRFWCDGGEPGCDGVFQSDGDTPLAGRQIRLEQIDGTNFVDGVTGADGTYTLSTKIPGSYRLRVLNPDIDGKDGAYYNGALISGPVGLFNAAGGSRTYEDEDFYYCPKPGRLRGLVFEENRERPCDGELQQDEEGNGLAGVTVSITGPVNRVINTNQNGSYLFTNLPAGNYTVVVDEVDMGTFGVSPSSTTSVDALVVGGGETVVNFAACRPAGIDGHVFKDPIGDCNGRYESGEGLEGWQVDLVQNGQVVRSETTDASGYFLFDELATGDYTVRLLVADPNTENCYLVTSDSNEEDINLVGGESEHVDFGFCIQRVCGRVFAEPYNTRDCIFDNADTPLEVVSVTITGIAGDALAQGYTAETTTDAAGNYCFTNIPTGQFEIVVTDSAGNETTLEGFDAQAPTLRDPLVNAGDDIADQDFCYTSTLQALSGRVWKESFLGTDGIWNPVDDTPLSGVEVEIVGTTGDAVGYSATTNTDDAGHYEFNDIPAGSYLIKVTDSAGNVTILEGLTGPTPSERTPNVGVNETVPNQDFYYVDPTQALSGRVWQEVYEDLNGVWEPGSDTPLGGVNVTITGTSGDALGQSFNTNTDVDGTYGFQNIPTGVYDVFVTDNAGNTVILGSLIAQDPTLRQPTVNAGDNVINQDFYYTGVMQNLSGRVWQEDYNELNSVWSPGTENDTPLANVEVSITGTDGDALGYSDTTTTNDEGFYSFQGIPAGTYTVVVTDSAGNQAIVGSLQAVPPTVRNPDVPVNGSVIDQDFVYTTTDQKLCGRVWEEDYTNTNGMWVAGEDTPLEGLEVSIVGTAGDALGYSDTTFTGADGMYNFEGIPSGTYLVTITDSAGNQTIVENLVGPTPSQRTPDVPVNGAAHDQDFYYVNRPMGCDEEQDICVKVFSEPYNNCDGMYDEGVDTPLAGVEMFVRELHNEDNYLMSAFTDENGEYCFKGLPPGMYEVYPGANQANLVELAVYSDGRDCRPVTLICGEDAFEAYGLCPKCEEVTCCEGLLHQVRFESDHFVGDIGPDAPISIKATLYDGPGAGANVIDEVEMDYSGMFPGSKMGLDGVLRVDYAEAFSWGTAVVRVSLRADSDVFPAGHFGDGTYRVEVTLNDDTAAGTTQFLCETVRRGSLFTYSNACGEMPPCDEIVDDPYQWRIDCSEGCVARFLVLETLSYDGWMDCSGEKPMQTLAGRVWWEPKNEENGAWDGAPMDTALGDVTVKIVGTAGDAMGYSSTTQTGADGSYSFSDIPAGTYLVKVSDDPATEVILDGLDAEDPTSYTPTLNDGDDVVNQDFYYTKYVCEVDFGAEVFTYKYRVPCEYSFDNMHHVELKILLGETDNIIDRVETEWTGDCWEGELDSLIGNLTLLKACKVGVEGDECLYEVTFRVNRDCPCEDVDTDADGQVDRWTEGRLCTTVDWVFSDDDHIVRFCPDINQDHVPNDV